MNTVRRVVLPTRASIAVLAGLALAAAVALAAGAPLASVAPAGAGLLGVLSERYKPRLACIRCGVFTIDHTLCGSRVACPRPSPSARRPS